MTGSSRESQKDGGRETKRETDADTQNERGTQTHTDIKPDNTHNI